MDERLTVGMVGLGRMGAGLRDRLRAHGHSVVGFDPGQAHADVSTLAGMVARLPQPRIVWLMVPAGEATDSALDELLPLLSPGDIVIEGGNSYHRDSVRRGAVLAGKGVPFLDVGTSGGIWGVANGFCLMAGGEAETFAAVEPLFRDLAPDGGYAHVGPTGAGHFAKMAHNGIEYGMMQALAEGFALANSADEYGFDLGTLAHLWNRGSVVRSWLLELTESALAADPALAGLRAHVDDSGEGRWTVIEGVERGVNVGVLAAALFARFTSREEEPFAMRLIAALRNEFGGHAVRPADR